MIERLVDLVNADAALVRRGRFLTTDFLVEVGDETFQVSVEAGRIAEVARGASPGRPWRFAIRASAEAWREFWQPCHDRATTTSP
jgi:hypothetical protein